MDPEPSAVGDLDPSLETDTAILSNFIDIGILHPPAEPTVDMSGPVDYTQGQEIISYQHSFQHNPLALQHQQPPPPLPLQHPEEIDRAALDTMQQSSNNQQSAEEPSFVITATGEFQCTFAECKTQPVFKRKCDLTCVPLHIPKPIPGPLPTPRSCVLPNC